MLILHRQHSCSIDVSSSNRLGNFPSIPRADQAWPWRIILVHLIYTLQEPARAPQYHTEPWQGAPYQCCMTAHPLLRPRVGSRQLRPLSDLDARRPGAVQCVVASSTIGDAS